MPFKKTTWEVCDYCDLVFMEHEIAYKDADGFKLCSKCEVPGVRLLNENDLRKYDKRKFSRFERTT